jgi:hypothetical protein
MQFSRKHFYIFYFGIIAFYLVGIYNQFLRPGLPFSLEQTPDGIRVVGKGITNSDTESQNLLLASVDGVDI